MGHYSQFSELFFVPVFSTGYLIMFYKDHFIMFFNNPAQAKKLAKAFKELSPWWLEYYQNNFNAFCADVINRDMLDSEVNTADW